MSNTVKKTTKFAIEPADLAASIMRSIAQTARGAVEELSESATDVGQAYIGSDAVNTHRDWNWAYYANDPRRLWRDREGRVDTGKMRDDFRAEVERVKTSITGGSVSVTVDVGWPADSPDYFQEQEEGFLWEDPDQRVQIQVPGMHVIPRVETYLNLQTRRKLNQAFTAARGRILRRNR